MNVIKRNGQKEPFDKMKIMNAVEKAFIEVDGKTDIYAKDKALNIAKYIQGISNSTELSVEEIQDIVERGLMSLKRKDVAKAYILYRNERTKERSHNLSIIFYSTNCPQCMVLEKKLKLAGISFKKNEDISKLIEKGYVSAPMLEVNNKFMTFAEARKWIEEVSDGHKN